MHFPIGSPSAAEDSTQTITLAVLNAVSRDASITQRSVAQELNLALGLVNAYLKRCVAKGFIKIHKVPPRRYAYYLTPTGFAEKRRLTAEYLRQCFKFLRAAQRDCAELFSRCKARRWQRVALYGISELSDLAVLGAAEAGIDLVAIIDPSSDRSEYHGLPVLRSATPSTVPWDAVVITDVRDAQGAFDLLIRECEAERILAPSIFGVVPCASNTPPTDPNGPCRETPTP